MKRLAVLCAVIGLTFTPVSLGDIYLDADTAATGSLLMTQPLVTAYGNITFDGQIRDRDGDPDFNAAGALGDVFDIDDTTQQAELFFDFDVLSATFIYGGNQGNISIEARDEFGAIVDSFFQASTADGELAGPITLSGSGIRSLFWEDTAANMQFAPLDNITITAVPVPGAGLLGLLGLSVAGAKLRKRREA